MSGDVTASEITSAVRINTVSGDVELSGRTARVQMVTVSGDLNVEIDALDISVDTISGEADLELGAFETLVATSKSGELNISGRLGAAGRVRAETVAGDIELKLTPPVHARIDVRTGPGGDIENELTDDEPTEVFPNRKELRFEAGGATGEIVLTTVSGEIRLER